MNVRIKKDALIVLMYEKGLNIRQLSEKCGIQYHHLTKVLNGIRGVTPRTANKLCTALDCNFDEIFELVDEEQKVASQ